MEFLVFLLVGAIAGWLAGKLMKGRGFGLVGNIVVGLVGGLLGGWLLGALDAPIGSGFISQILTSLIGASTLLFGIGLIKKS
ncbi:MAG: GlsB/YeaQ/YmgE family stress response membrane protein [Verrucomicrobiales bacterium]